MAVQFEGQSFSALKKGCQQKGCLFEDPVFPATDESLFYESNPIGEIHWLRPSDLCNEPHLFVGKISAHDVPLGPLGNMWFISACATVIIQDSLWQKVIPDSKDQDFVKNKHFGIFHFRFWRFGKWMDVVIDDRLPTVNGQLLYCNSSHRNEFWCPLLEKAYAKLLGRYEALNGGNTADALMEFTGGISEPVNLVQNGSKDDDDKRDELFERVLKVRNRAGLISCSIRLSISPEQDERLENDLIKGHTYCVMDMRKLKMVPLLQNLFNIDKLYIVRMRSQSGQVEWNGPWSESSDEWNKLSKSDRDKLGLHEKEGEFWITFEDVVYFFTDMVLCRLIHPIPVNLCKTWKEVVICGSWRHNDDPNQNRAGGCFNNLNTYFQNPQYMFDVSKIVDEVMISLHQQDQKTDRGRADYLSIGFDVQKVELNRIYRMHATQQKVGGTNYVSTSFVSQRLDLTKGRYIIIPTTFEPGEQGDFMLRLVTELQPACRELLLDEPPHHCWTGLVGYPTLISQVHVLQAHGLAGDEADKASEPYVLIRCEGQIVRAGVRKPSCSPVFDTKGIFYRKKASNPITIEIYNHQMLKDFFLGRVTLPAEEGKVQKTLHLKDKGDHEDNELPGTITLSIETSSVLTYF